MQQPDGSVETYTCGADGPRQTKEIRSATAKCVWDGQNLLLETDGGGTTQAHYTDFPGFWGGLNARRQGSGPLRLAECAGGATVEVGVVSQGIPH